MKYGYWTVIQKTPGDKWLCACECGTRKEVRWKHLLNRTSTSCGCYRRAIMSRPRKHGLSKTRFYHIYAMIQQRCNNPHQFAYSRYGGRGILCFWKSFESFRDDMYESYLEHVRIYGEKQTTIDRINNNGHYIKTNCRWATYKEQANNTRATTRTIEYQGQNYTLSQLAQKLNIKKETLRQRHYHGTPLDKVFRKFSTPVLATQRKALIFSEGDKATLNPRELSILTYRFTDHHTLEETGEIFHVTKQRIQQIETCALLKVIHSTY